MRRCTYILLGVLLVGACTSLAGRNPHVTDGILNMQASRYKAAEADFKEAIESDSTCSDAHMWLGKSYASQRRYVDAAREFDKALSMKPAHGNEFGENPLYFWAVYYNAGIDHKENRDLALSKRCLSRAVEIQPDSMGPKVLLSQVEAEQESGETGRSEPESQEQTKELKSFPHDFRQAKWGMTRAQAKETESGRPYEQGEEGFVYKRKVSGFDCYVLYKFIEEKLASAGYIFYHEHSNENDYISDYKKLKSVLTKKYGEPSTDLVNWKNDLFKNDPQSWGMAVSAGHLEYLASWETTTTNIHLGLTGENYKLNLLISYESKELKKIEKKVEEKKEMEDL